MSQVEIVFFEDEKGKCPVLDWFSSLPRKVEAKGRARIEELEKHGHELRRPMADYLRDGIYELRWRLQSVNYRVLYFFHERKAVVLSHGFTKEDVVPDKEINQALKNKELFGSNPDKYNRRED